MDKSAGDDDSSDDEANLSCGSLEYLATSLMTGNERSVADVEVESFTD
jgi:hypothetical protein